MTFVPYLEPGTAARENPIFQRGDILGVSKERQAQLRAKDRKEVWAEIIYYAKMIADAGGGKIKIGADWKSIDWYKPFVECREEAKKLTEAGYGKVKFSCPILDERKARKSPRRDSLREQVERSAPFILDEKRGWVK